MKTVIKLGLDYDTMNKNGESWENPEDIIDYIRGGLNYLIETNDRTDPDTIAKRNRWIKYCKQAIDCLDII